MLINGDAYKELVKLKSSSVDLILIDPPYSISRDSNFKNSKNSLSYKYDISIDFGYWDSEQNLEILFREFYRVLKKSGTIITFYDIWKSGDVKEAADSVGFKQARIGAWVKTNPVPINSTNNYLSNATEYFFTFIKGSKPTFNSKYDNAFYSYPLCHGHERLKHPTQKPLKLIKKLVEKHSNPGDLVLDVFAGTGTTGHACSLTGRRYIMVEQDLKYFKIMCDRLSTLQKIDITQMVIKRSFILKIFYFFKQCITRFTPSN